MQLNHEQLVSFAAVFGPIITALLSGYLTWRFKSSAEGRRGFQALIDANDKFRDAMFREVERKEQVIRTLSKENNTLRKENERLRHNTDTHSPNQ